MTRVRPEGYHKDYYARTNGASARKWREANKERIAAYDQRMRQEARDYIQQVKEEIPCADCGRHYAYYVMDFDHVRGVKTANVSLMASKYTLPRIKLEIAKCEVVCANCHRERTHKRALALV